MYLKWYVKNLAQLFNDITASACIYLAKCPKKALY